MRYFYCVERPIFYLERYGRLFMGLIDLKTENKKIWIFWPKPRTNPKQKCKFFHFMKTTNLPLFKFDVFIV